MTREAGLHGPAAADALLAGRATVHGHSIGWPDIDWFPDWERLATMELHYLDWLWGLATHRDRSWAAARCAEVLASWSAAVAPGQWMPWHPYTTACRAWNLAQLVPTLFDEVPDDLARLVWFHGDQLVRNLEHDVRGNHLVRDLRGLVAVGLATGEQGWVKRGLTGLVGCVDEQVLADGGHHERSPYYHVQVLVDLTEVVELVDGCGGAVPDALRHALPAMRGWLDAVTPNADELPVVNDGLRRARRRVPWTPAGTGVRHLAASGYAVARTGPWWALVDVGTPAPRHLPAHGHCSLLSLELAHEGRPLLVNAGSSTYDDAVVRAVERGTLGHNTVRVDGTEQSEVWDRFRIGRQAEPRGVEVGDVDGTARIVGAHDGYRRLPGAPVHWRRVEVSDAGVQVEDRLVGGASHEAEGIWRFAVGVEPRGVGGGAVVVDGLVVRVSGADAVELVPADAPGAAWVATGYGHRAPVASLRWRAAGPAVAVRTSVVREP